MNRDPLGLGVLLYGFRVPAGDPVNLTLLASGWHMDGLAAREFELAHEGCSISTFCKNPLHPGPCKGWRKKLGIEAPGALKAIKAAESESLAKRRAKIGEAKSAAAKKTAHLVSPLHAKKATAKHAAVLLGNDEHKAGAKAAKVILNKQEIKKYSKIKAAHINSIRTKHGLTEDPGMEDRIAEALAKDNAAGHDTNYRDVIAVSSASLGAQLADKHCKKGDGDCDGIPFENLRDTLGNAAETALLTGDDSELDTALDDYAAGKTPKANKPPAAAAPRPVAPPEPKPKAEPKVSAAEPKAAAPEPPPVEPPAKAEPATPAKEQAEPAAPDAPSAPASNAEKAQVGMKFGLGLAALGKGNKTLGTKAQQKAFADKIQGELDGEEKWQGVTKHGADTIANALVSKTDLHPFAHPTLGLTSKEKAGIKTLAAGEIEQGLKGDPGPFPVVDSLKKAVTAWHDKDNKAMKGASAELQGAIKTATAKKLGVDPNAPAHIVAAHVLFKPDANYGDGNANVRVSVLNQMTAEEFGDLPLAQREEIKKWLADRIDTFDPATDSHQKAVALEQKLGLPSSAPPPAKPKIEVKEMTEVKEPDVLQGLINGVPEATGHSTAQKAAIDATNSMIPDAQAHAAYDALSKDEFDALDPKDQKAILNDLGAIAKPPLESPDLKAKADATAAKLKGEPAPAAPVAPSGISVTGLKQMFGDDGDPDHQEVVAAVDAMNQHQFEQLSYNEKGNLAAHLADAQLNGEPGADAAAVKVGKLGLPVVVPSSAPVKSTSPGAKKASNYALGVVSGTAKRKLTAYEKVSGAEFEDLTGTEQKAILDDLDAIGSKFLDPKKVAQAKKHKDYLSGYAGGGTGAGGPLDTTAPPAMTDDEKADVGGKVLAEMIDAAGGFTDPGQAKDSGAKVLKTGAQNGNYPNLADNMADFQAGIAMESLANKHLDPFGQSMFDPAAIAEIKPKLAEDIAKKLKAEPGATPVYDAWLKAVKSGDEDDAQAVADAATGFTGGTFGGTAPTPLAQKGVLKTALMETWKQAGFGTTPYHAPQLDEILNEHVDDATEEGWLGPAHISWAKDFGDAQAHTMMDQGLGKELGFDVAQKASFKPNLVPSVTALLGEDFNEKLLTGDAGGGTGAASEFAKTVSKVKNEGDKTASKNGWSSNSAAVKAFQHGLMEAELEKILAKYSGAGTGGAPNPGTSHAPGVPHAAAPPSPSVPTVPSAPFVPTPLGTGSGVGHLSTAKQTEILDDFKGFSTGKFLSDPKEPTYGNLLALASVHGTPDEPLSVMQVLQAVDNSLAAKLGVTNTNLWEKEFTSWLQTPEGAKFAADNPAPDANLVKKLSGVYDGITTDLGELAKKVKLLPGPGQFDESKPSSDFQYTNATAAYKWKAEMLADQGGKFTPDQLEGIKVYTGNSYGAMNRWLRGLTGSIDAYSKKSISQAQDSMRPLPKDTLLVRGTGWDALPEGFRSPSGAKKLIGQTVMDEAFMSTSVGKTPGLGSGHPLWLIIEAPKGTHAAFVEGSGVSTNPGEREMLLAAGQSYRILGVEDVGGKTHVRVRIVTESV